MQFGQTGTLVSFALPYLVSNDLVVILHRSILQSGCESTVKQVGWLLAPSPEVGRQSSVDQSRGLYYNSIAG